MYKITFLNDNAEKNMEKRGLEILKSYREDFERFMKNLGDEDVEQEFYEYGLGFDYDGEEQCHTYALSTGGPQAEIRFHDDGTIEFAFLDWWSGVGFDVTHDEVFVWLRDYFVDAGMMESAE